VDYVDFIDRVIEQADAMRQAVITAGPDAAVFSCPQWTVRDLVRHMAKVHQWSATCLRTARDAERPHPSEPPEDWEELLSWWAEQIGILVGTLRASMPDDPAWVFAPSEPKIAAFWARRQAHETAIHRLDAEHAAAKSDRTDAVPSLVFDPEFAADGVDEALRVIIPGFTRRVPPTVSGTVLFHAADAGRAWLVEAAVGDPATVHPAEPGMDADASVVGTADAVYRAVWRRPSTAVLGGDPAVLAGLRTP
jgi:uncharacterized protein (TIGR03083 family)